MRSYADFALSRLRTAVSLFVALDFPFDSGDLTSAVKDRERLQKWDQQSSVIFYDADSIGAPALAEESPLLDLLRKVKRYARSWNSTSLLWLDGGFDRLLCVRRDLVDYQPRSKIEGARYINYFESKSIPGWARTRPRKVRRRTALPPVPVQNTTSMLLSISPEVSRAPGWTPAGHALANFSHESSSSYEATTKALAPADFDEQKQEFLKACAFCRRSRTTSASCRLADPDSEDRTCYDCQQRSLKCEYPLQFDIQSNILARRRAFDKVREGISYAFVENSIQLQTEEHKKQ
ncbi:hypothetical protein J3R30DRAFT_892397 [Lentinula aciculospora]|uniref:Zn(2)-C6 fungal-type domain-containing protein n=1 Tax=Lentinula aciculospora TaxID=153920 RepID=A0A9W9DWZ2_9AGAR|nr:hypothetical protein J3R30DRAFT_892397 [Lentinula aciculospora]